jgi:hypothetical protein
MHAGKENLDATLPSWYIEQAPSGIILFRCCE